jgi:hypothetical protein
MKRIFALLLIIAILGGMGASSKPGSSSGAIWTTRGDCGTLQQDRNHYKAGEEVYINGRNFEPGIYDWTITGQSGHASCDPGTEVAGSTINITSRNSFCFLAYVVKEDDCGEYTTDVGKKNDNYRVDWQHNCTTTTIPTAPESPETTFPITLFIITPLIAYSITRKK